MYVYVVCKVYICVHSTPNIYHIWTLSGMVRSINIIFSENAEQYDTLCCAAGVTRSNSRGPASLTSQGRAEPLCARIESANREVSEGKADL